MRNVLQFCAVSLLAALGSALVLPAAPVSQSIPFNHAKHATLTCAGCHTGVETAQHAGLPSAATCARCHAAAPAVVPAVDWDRLQKLGAEFWKPITRLPAHVMFSHRRHVSLGRLACESCHADIGRRASPPPRMPVRLTMNTCLACHRAEGASEDCAGCHR